MSRGLLRGRFQRLRKYRLLILFFSGLALLDLLIAKQKSNWELYSPDDYAEKVRACRRVKPEVLVVGGSPVSEGIDPEALRGLVWDGRTLERVYALGLSGATTTEVWHEIEHGASQPPRLLIYGISASDMNEVRNEPHGPASLMSWHDLREWHRLRPGSSEWATRHFIQSRLGNAWQLFRYRNGIRLWSADRIETTFPGAVPDCATEARTSRAYAESLRRGNGYTPNSGMVNRSYAEAKAMGWVAPPFHFLDRFQIGHLKYIQKIIDWSQEHGVAAFLLDMPISEDLENRHRDVFTQYRQWLHEVEKGGKIGVIHARREVLGLNDGHFADLIHLNGEGAAILSRWLRKELESRQ